MAYYKDVVGAPGQKIVVSDPDALITSAEEYGATPGATAAVNTAAIQAALDAVGNAGGGVVTISTQGVYRISSTLYVPSDVSFIPDRGVEISCASGATCFTLIANKAYGTSPVTATLTWVSPQQTVSVAWPGHGLTVNDFVMLYQSGAVTTLDSAYKGVFAVTSVTDANNFIVKLWRTPTVAPAVVCLAKKADKNILICGTYTQNFVGGTNDGLLNNSMAIILSAVADCETRNIYAHDLQKYAVYVAGSVRYRHKNLVGGVGHMSDGVKVFGPALGAEVDGITGTFGDDAFSFQGTSPAAYMEYDITSGDVIDCKAKNVRPMMSNTVTASAYVDNWTLMTGLTFEGIGGFGAGFGKIVSDGFAGANAGCITFRDCLIMDTGQGGITIGAQNGGSLGTVQSVIVDGIQNSSKATLAAFYMVTVTNGTIKRLALSDIYAKTGSLYPGGVLKITNATVEYATVDNMEYVGPAATNIDRPIVLADAVVKKFELRNSYVENVDNAIWAGGGTPELLSLVDNVIVNASAGIAAEVVSSLYFRNNRCVGNMSQGFARTFAPSGAFKIYSGGGNTLNSGTFVINADATSLTELYAWDFKVAMLTTNGFSKTVRGQYATTAGAVGTINPGSLVTCNGTNWVQLDSPTLLY